MENAFIRARNCNCLDEDVVSPGSIGRGTTGDLDLDAPDLMTAGHINNGVSELSPRQEGEGDACVMGTKRGAKTDKLKHDPEAESRSKPANTWTNLR